MLNNTRKQRIGFSVGITYLTTSALQNPTLCKLGKPRFDVNGDCDDATATATMINDDYDVVMSSHVVILVVRKIRTSIQLH